MASRRPITSWPSPKQARTEAADFTKLTSQREQQREAAHADVVKAQLQQQQRERELSDARLAARESPPRTWRAALSRSAHCVYPGRCREIPPLPSRAEVEQAAGKKQSRIAERARHSERRAVPTCSPRAPPICRRWA